MPQNQEKTLCVCRRVVSLKSWDWQYIGCWVDRAYILEYDHDMYIESRGSEYGCTCAITAPSSSHTNVLLYQSHTQLAGVWEALLMERHEVDSYIFHILLTRQSTQQLWHVIREYNNTYQHMQSCSSLLHQVEYLIGQQDILSCSSWILHQWVTLFYCQPRQKACYIISIM